MGTLRRWQMPAVTCQHALAMCLSQDASSAAEPFGGADRVEYQDQAGQHKYGQGRLPEGECACHGSHQNKPRHLTSTTLFGNVVSRRAFAARSVSKERP